MKPQQEAAGNRVVESRSFFFFTSGLLAALVLGTEILVAILGLGIWAYLLLAINLIALLGFFSYTLFRFTKLHDGNLDRQRSLLNTSKYAALGEVAAGMAHEINTPLGVITLSASQLRDLDYDKPESKEFAKEIAADVIVAGEKIARIVRGVKNFSRDSGKGADFVFCDLPSVISEAAALCEASLRTAGVKLLPLDLPKSLDLQCNPSQISQVIVNLVNNSRDAVGGLEEKWIEVSLKGTGDSVEIRVKDSGKGIPAEARDKLFQPFYTTKEIGKGTGLGLSIVHGIVRAHKGEIFVDDKCPNTCFVVQLPRLQAS